MEQFKNVDIDSIISFLTSAEVQDKLLPTKIAFLVVSAVFLGIIVFVLLRTHYLEWLFIQDLVQFFSMKTYGTKKINRQWQRVLRRLDTGLESEYKLAVLEADRMLDNSLKKMGYTGATLEERLGKLTSVTLPNIEELQQTRNVRGNILHDPDYRLELSEARKILKVYDEAFRDLQILS